MALCSKPQLLPSSQNAQSLFNKPAFLTTKARSHQDSKGKTLCLGDFVVKLLNSLSPIAAKVD